jgi:hypothetical protein
VAENVVMEIPDRGLMGVGIVKDVVRVAIPIEVSGLASVSAARSNSTAVIVFFI